MILRRILRILPALGLATAGLDAASPHEGHAPVAGTADLRASVAADTKGTVWLVSATRGFLEVRRSNGTGTAWSEPSRVNQAPEALDPGGDARPKIALGPGGEILVTWTRALAKPYTGEIRLARSTDGGATFTPPITVHRDRAEITHRFDALAVSGGHVFVAWIDRRDAVAAAAAGATYRGAAVYFSVSSDGGATFAPERKVADHACECCRVALLPAREGGVEAMWRHIFEPNIRDHAAATLSANAGADRFRRVTFDDWRVDACPHHGPSLAADPAGRLHGVWFTGGPEGGQAYYGMLDRGPGEPAPRRLGGRLANHPDLAIDGPRRVAAWKDFSDGRTQLKVLVTRDAGRTWDERVVASTDGASDQPRALAAGGRLLVIWNRADQPFAIHEVAP